MNKKLGFTIVELLVVSTILALLAAMGMVSYASASRNSRNAKRQSDLEQVRAAMELYRSDNSAYPSDTDFVGLVQTLQDDQYITSNISDPKPAPYTQYSLNLPGACTNYQLCAELEPNAQAHCVCNP